MKLYTKTGDKGKTGLFGGARLSKNSRRIEAYGTVDELNSVMGIVRAHTQKKEMTQFYKKIQNTLFHLGADLAAPKRIKQERLVLRISDSEIQFLEKNIDVIQKKVPISKNFILPGGGIEASYLHLARTICRRAERRCVSLSEKEDIGKFCIAYLNRLSDFLFICARFANFSEGLLDIEWRKGD